MRPPTERDILLCLLLAGDSLPITIGTLMGRHTKSVSRSIQPLIDDGLIVEKDRGVYALTPEGYAEARRVLTRRAEDSGG
jgi:Mn-dependent DtxR family transcriptional regulator